MNAKSLCDQLIVGVSTDELVAYKNKKAVIPFQERMEIVRCIKYVDATIAQENMNKFEAWKKLKFNVLFVGDDWFDTLNFVAFNPLQNNNPIAVRRRKLVAKIDEQIQLAANKDYTPTQHKWVTDEHGNQRKVEVARRVKRWWTASVDGKINLVVRYGSKPLEFAKGKNAIELASEAEVADALAKVREAAELGELDALIEKQAQFGRRVTQKN